MFDGIKREDNLKNSKFWRPPILPLLNPPKSSTQLGTKTRQVSLNIFQNKCENMYLNNMQNKSCTKAQGQWIIILHLSNGQVISFFGEMS